MRRIPLKVSKSLDSRKQMNAFRKLSYAGELLDFSSNDYLGLASSEEIFDHAHELLLMQNLKRNGATGSRLLSGNHRLYDETESFLADYHEAEAALIFNSGYDANIGFFSSVPKRGDLIFYDELVHASIRDGISMSHAKALKFKHNDLEDLIKLAERNKNTNAEVYVVTESVFSMDGDSPDLHSLVRLSEANNFYVVIDEAHAVGVYGKQGEGLVQELGLQDKMFARINTFGKAVGAHGAVILGSEELKDYLINFARSFIYTTGLPPHSVATILTSYKYLMEASEMEKLRENIKYFIATLKNLELESRFIKNDSAIHCCIIPGNDKVKEIAMLLQEKGFDVKAILSPTVSAGKERLRFCLHSYNSKEEIKELLSLLSTFVK